MCSSTPNTVPNINAQILLYEHYLIYLLVCNYCKKNIGIKAGHDKRAYGLKTKETAMQSCVHC